MHSDDAFGFLAARLRELMTLERRVRRLNNYDCDLWLPQAILSYWTLHGRRGSDINEIPNEDVEPFYDAAWELCRIGVLRPGQHAPKGQAMGAGLFSGDGYSITSFGAKWVHAEGAALGDSSRLGEILDGLGTRFGSGYQQRAAEAVRCYKTRNYLAACTLSGAAAESLLLSIAVARFGGDEAKVLSMYRSQGGRGRVMSAIVTAAGNSAGTQFQHASQILNYWRDEASHGVATTISEIEAHMALTQLLRLSQFATDHWAKLTVTTV
jgi:hypothetical protein